MTKKKVAIFGGGPSALAAAYFLSNDFNISIYEKEKNVGQKFLVAGKGGFNLTNSLTGIDLAKKYSPQNFLNDAILNFDSIKVIDWLQSLGISTFIGSSGRVFSSDKHKPFEVLESIKSALVKKGVSIYTSHKFEGFDKNKSPIIICNNEVINVGSDFYIFGLGGASWSITGSDGKWIDAFESIGIETIPFQSSNCGININWSENISEHHIGKPLKNINIIVSNNIYTGEAVITKYGLEGNLIYSAVPEIRKLLSKEIQDIYLDLKPNNSSQHLLNKISNQKPSTESYKRKLNFNSTEIALIKSQISKKDFLDYKKFVENIKGLKLKVNSLRPIEEAISTVGGIKLSELNSNFSLKKYPNIFTIGEMVDWDAPTGGFLLQASFSMGNYVAQLLSEPMQ